jgi:transposase
MRGRIERQESMLSLMTPEKRVPKDHPIRRIKEIADRELEKLSPVFDQMYASQGGRYSIPPETLLKSLLLIALYTVRSERQFCERLQYDLLFRFFLDMGIEEDAFDHSTFTKNRDRLIDHEVAQRFFEGVVEHARGQRLISGEHFTVDGTLIEAWASMKSVRPKGEKPEDRPPTDDPGNPTVNFRGERRTNETHQSTTDPEALMARKGKGKEAKLCFSGHVLMENRNGLCVDITVVQATGTAEREQALSQLGRLEDRGFHPRTLGGDKGYDVRSFVRLVQDVGVTPHVAQNTSGRRSSIDGRTTRHVGYELSQRIRKRVEEIFGWGKTTGGLRRTRYRGVIRTGFWGYIVGAAYNLIRMARLQTAEGVA